MKFRMVDRIVAWEPRRAIRGVKTVSFEEYRLKAPLGETAHLPETLLVESLFQLGNWLVVLTSDFTQMGMIVRIGEVTFVDRLGPGQRLDMDITVRRYRDDGILFDGTATVAGRVIASGTGCLAIPVPLAEYHDPADLRVLYREICRDEEASGDGSA
ncbi:MAG: hypothetical protein WBF17_09375 [Phycisphaerae bacterium]